MTNDQLQKARDAQLYGLSASAKYHNFLRMIDVAVYTAMAMALLGLVVISWGVL